MTLFSVTLPVSTATKLKGYRFTIHGEFGAIKWCYILATNYDDLKAKFGKNLIDFEKLGNVYDINSKKDFENE